MLLQWLILVPSSFVVCHEEETPSNSLLLNSSAARKGDNLKLQVVVRLVSPHLSLQCPSYRLVDELSKEIVQPAETQSDHRYEAGVSRQEKLTFHSPGALLPGSAVELDVGAADGGRAVHRVDRGAACLVALDGDAGTDGEIADAQVEGAAVLSVKRSE